MQNFRKKEGWHKTWNTSMAKWQLETQQIRHIWTRALVFWYILIPNNRIVLIQVTLSTNIYVNKNLSIKGQLWPTITNYNYIYICCCYYQPYTKNTLQFKYPQNSLYLGKRPEKLEGGIRRWKGEVRWKPCSIFQWIRKICHTSSETTKHWNWLTKSKNVLLRNTKTGIIFHA